MAKDIGVWTRNCLECQKAKIIRHTSSPLQQFGLPRHRFDHVHIDIVGPLPPSDGFTYLLTCIDRYTRWPEAIPMTDITAETVARTFVNCWVARFGVPGVITTDQGRQFQSRLFTTLNGILGVTQTRSSPYHPACNGLVERFHRSLKQALRCHKTKWTEALPLVLLGLRSSLKTDIDGTVAELVYGTPLRLPNELWDNPSVDTQPHEFLIKLREVMQSLKPVPTSDHSKRTIFVHGSLMTCTHVFVRCDAVKKPLQNPYDGPFRVLQRNDKNFTIRMKGRNAVVSIDRLKPAFMETQDPTDCADDQDEPMVTRSGRRVRFQPRYP